jgi:hypothetical protein
VTWRRVISAADCIDCPACSEPVCPECDAHYADCDCPGPTQDGIEYEERDGVLYAREIVQ